MPKKRVRLRNEKSEEAQQKKADQLERILESNNETLSELKKLATEQLNEINKILKSTGELLRSSEARLNNIRSALRKPFYKSFNR